MLYAPKEFSDYVTNELIRKGIGYVESDNDDSLFADPKKGFNCWGLVWYLFKYTGHELPRNPIQVRELFDEIDKPEFHDVVIFKNFDPIERRHLGFMETHRIVLQCSGTTGGVARVYLSLFNAPYRLFRLKEYAPNN